MSRRKPSPQRDQEGDFGNDESQRHSRKRERKRRRKGDHPISDISPYLDEDFYSNPEDDSDESFEYDEESDEYWDDDDEERFR